MTVIRLSVARAIARAPFDILFAVLAVAALAAPAGAQVFDAPEVPIPDAGPAQQRAGSQASGQATSRAAATDQLAAPAAPAAQFRAEQIPTSVVDRTASDGATPPAATRYVASEFETYVSGIVDMPLLRFGAALLVPGARGFTAPPTTTVPTDYRLNPGDELIIGLTGSIVSDGYRATVDSDGRIFVPRVGSVVVGGVRYGDVNRVISAEVARQYRDFHLSVAVARLHGITVYVTGFAAQPGSYTVSSLSTLVDGVLAAGGPTGGGSFRNIQLRRDGRLVSTFDLYDLLLHGDKSGDRVLQNGDILFIAPAGPQVAAIGSVNAQAIFEAKPGETLADILAYAGGPSTAADDTRALLLDAFQTRATGWTELSAGALAAQPARRGEIVRVLSGIGLAGPQRSQAVLVTVSGEVGKPGRYFLPPGTTLGAVLGQAGGLTPQAYPFAAVVTRESVRTQQRASYQRAIADLQFTLTAQPLTAVAADAALQPARLAAVQSLVSQLTARKPEGRLVLDLPPAAAALPDELVLENNDTVFVPPTPVTVGVFGAVPNPASFVYTASGTVGDYLARAGGVGPVGDRRHIVVVHANGAVISAWRGGSHHLLAERLLPGDLVFVPIDGNRGAFWARLRDLTSALFTGALGAAAVASIAR